MNKITTAATPITIHHTGSIRNAFRLPRAAWRSQGALRARNGKQGDYCSVRGMVPNLDRAGRKRKKNPVFFLEIHGTLIIVRVQARASLRVLGIENRL